MLYLFFIGTYLLFSNWKEVTRKAPLFATFTSSSFLIITDHKEYLALGNDDSSITKACENIRYLVDKYQNDIIVKFNQSLGLIK